tara:strand:- start:9814 stop:10761 length:948 start_codon:yes stop_codon:yes gene_type:complete
MNRVNELFGIKYPIIQGGMVWCSGWKLCSAVSNAGGLGLIGSGSMYSDLLEDHILKCQKATNNPFGVNIPLLYPHVETHIQKVIDNNVKIVFTSAGDPKKYTKTLKSHNIKVVHVISNLKFAQKSIDAGVDAIVVEGFEAGGHNGKNETTTMCLVPLISKNVDIPIISAGGISCGKSMLAALSLGADGVQIGSRFAVSKESSAHIKFKNQVIKSKEGDTTLTMKDITPVRLLKNEFYQNIKELYVQKKSTVEIRAFLGKGRAKKGIFEGDLSNGELEIGQVSSSIESILTAEEIIESIVQDYKSQLEKVNKNFIL